MVSDEKAEKWKAVQKAIPIGNKVLKSVGLVFGPAAVEMGGLIADQIKHLRASNLDRITQKWSKIIRKRKLAPEVLSHLPFGDAIAVIEAASREEDDDVQELWARIIANATDINVKQQIKKNAYRYLKIAKWIRSADSYGDIRMVR